MGGLGLGGCGGRGGLGLGGGGGGSGLPLYCTSVTVTCPNGSTGSTAVVLCSSWAASCRATASLPGANTAVTSRSARSAACRSRRPLPPAGSVIVTVGSCTAPRRPAACSMAALSWTIPSSTMIKRMLLLSEVCTRNWRLGGGWGGGALGWGLANTSGGGGEGLGCDAPGTGSYCVQQPSSSSGTTQMPPVSGRQVDSLRRCAPGTAAAAAAATAARSSTAVSTARPPGTVITVYWVGPWRRSRRGRGPRGGGRLGATPRWPWRLCKLG